MPPKVKKSWDENDILTRASILAFSDVRDQEDFPPEPPKGVK